MCKTKTIFFTFALFFAYHLCEKCYKPIAVQYHIAGCVSLGLRLTLLDLQMHSEQRVVRTFVVRGLTVLMKPPP